ncbi:hypothetical protein BDP27DRAFT_1368509 [Rhodocollybia butyracea]|uniref:Uncharacterized protein n=1 Tax=Rhodocollybia butyracea TaxID=206335 RepID=A0A9P5U1Y4_9AGAR|nr:hypothetical protein BDP27DRAFT_1368509 [Rhodocollybia butyracea]
MTKRFTEGWLFSWSFFLGKMSRSALDMAKCTLCSARWHLYTGKIAVPMVHLQKKFTVRDLVKICQSVPPIKVEIKLVPIAGLEGFVSASNTKHVEVWIPELELVLNIDHNCLRYQPNLTALGEVLLDPGHLISLTVLDVKVDFATHSGFAVLVRPDGRSTTSWVDYSRLRRDDNRRFLHEDQHRSSRLLHYSFKRGYVPSYSDQELLALNGYLNPEYKAKMAQALGFEGPIQWTAKKLMNCTELNCKMN